MAGAGKGNGKGPAVATGAIMGGFLLLGLVMAGVAATIVLSLISIYTSDNSSQGNGDYFKISTFGLKTLFPNSASSFSSGSVAESTSLSSLCTSMYTSNSSASNFYGCKATNFKATSANNSNTSRRRRQAESAVFLLGEIRVYYKTSCGNSGDKDKGTNSSSISSCVKSRLSQCNLLFGTGAFRAWTPVSTVSTLNIVSSSGVWTSITPSRIFAASQSQTANYASSAFSNSTAASLANFGCVYAGPVSLAVIAADLASQSTATTTAASTTAASG